MKNSQSFRGIINAIWYVVLFLLVQSLVSIMGMVAWALYQGKGHDTSFASLQQSLLANSTFVITIQVVSSLLVIAIFAWCKYTPFKRSYLASHPWATLFWVVIMTFGTIIPSIWLQERLDVDMPESMENLLMRMMSHPLGYLAIGIMAPLAEEVVFRGAILRTLLRVFGNRWHWVAIVISAIVFGAVHGNMPQFINASLVGVLLGWMYYRTGSIVPGIVYHWVNNSIAFVMFNLMPGMEDAKLVDIFKGSQTHVYLALLFSACIFLPALYQLSMRLRKSL
ncbi:MAG: CPBP family intramembrane metalloprotease [Prevotella sp.]|nr:CPBP family intramembrane metalloprotease [Prevotella sp.]